jgi:hypothetical protein
MKVRSDWKSDTRQRVGFDARQVKCLTLDAGHVWIHYYDRLPPPVRRRLRESAFNLCAACLDIEARKEAAARGLRRPTIGTYFDLIAAIERELNKPPRK